MVTATKNRKEYLMGDEIPNSEYSLICPNPKCGHGNLKWRMFCASCGTRLHPVVEAPKDK